MKLRCENLVKKYGPRTVVKGVSMEVNQGESVGFLGPNGAGKTTSFYMITGLIVPNAGKSSLMMRISLSFRCTSALRWEWAISLRRRRSSDI